MKIDENKTISMVNPIHLNDYQMRMQNVRKEEIDVRQKHRVEVITMDLTCRACLKHARELGIPGDDFTRNYIETLNTSYRHVTHTIQYPDDIIKSVTPEETDEVYYEEFDGLDMVKLRKRLQPTESPATKRRRIEEDAEYTPLSQ